MKFHEGLQTIKSGSPGVFALVGDEPYLKWRFIKAAEVIRPESISVFFYPGDEEDAISSLSSIPVSGSRIVVLRNFEKFNLKKFKRISKNGTDVFIFEISEEAEKTRDLTEFMTTAEVIECKKFKPYGSEYSSWISSRFKDYEYSYEEGCCEDIYGLVGPNMFMINNELRKLFLYKNDSRYVSREDVRMVVCSGKVSAPYELLDSILHKDVKKIFEYLDRYMKSDDDYSRMVSFLGTYFEKMYKIILMKEKGFDANRISDLLGIPGFIVKTRYLPKVSSLGKEFFSNFMAGLSELDINLRTFKGDKKIIVEKYFSRFIISR